MKGILIGLLALGSISTFAGVELPSGHGPLISKEEFNQLTTCEKKVVNESIRVLKKDNINQEGNIVLGKPNLAWTDIEFSSMGEEFDTYSFKNLFPQYFPWQVIFKATPRNTRDVYTQYAHGDKFGFDVLTTIPKKAGFFSSDRDCEIINYKTDPVLVNYYEVQSGKSKNSNGTARIFVLTNF
jgi:hypothetical protein